MSSKVKKFNGKVFHKVSQHSKKLKAHWAAKKVRDSGKLSRSVKEGKVWVVYQKDK